MTQMPRRPRRWTPDAVYEQFAWCQAELNALTADIEEVFERFARDADIGYRSPAGSEGREERTRVRVYWASRKECSRTAGTAGSVADHPLEATDMRNGTPAQWFVEKIAFSDAPEDCWHWLGSTWKGYGEFGTGEHGSRKAHRFAYELWVGPIPEGLVIDHLCRNRGCVNPGHLEPVTSRENTLRGRYFVSAQIAKSKTHCVHGHPYGDDPYFDRNGWRRCRECARLAKSEAKVA